VSFAVTDDDYIEWREMLEIEPRLGRLYQDILAIRDDGTAKSFCANDRWFRHGLKDRLTCLVGFRALSGNPRLQTVQAYETALEKLYGALPDCRDYGCS
jgi:hypothetical protein